ncbi:MAG: RNA polymerase sigma factor [Ktedonobacteraceae bacterium]|nr:RNA polymerase sigma factor [Ktedonobacteraceae bacterium]MBO0797168.1 RNA polymerase sigma factor [Ktedonobacteraceae bacterium]
MAKTGDSSPYNAAQSPSLITLVRRARDGNQSAFEALYALYNDPISRYLSRMVGNDGVGCELTQETFLKAWLSLPGLREPERFVGWLYRIASNCAYDYQKRTRHIQVIPLETYTGGDALSVSGPEESIEEVELLKLALALVPRIYRECLILYEIEELPQRQIAELVHIKEASVSKYVSRGKEKLRQMYYQLVREQNSALAQGRRGQ